MRFKVLLSVFVISLFVGISKGLPTVYPLIFGLALFSYDGYKKGLKLKDWDYILKVGFGIVKNLLVIFCLIGFLTAGWRLSGTIQYLVYYGTSIINPRVFYLFAYLLTLAMSMLLGSINGVITTMGIVIISLARANGADLLITTGAILAGGIFGDRMSPVSSAAYLVAELTKTNPIENRKYMFRTIIFSSIITGFLFLILSLKDQNTAVNTSLLEEIKGVTNLSHLCAIPALAIIILSIIKVKTKTLLLISTILSITIAFFVQKLSLAQIGRDLVFGVRIENLTASLETIVNSGGLKSMIFTLMSISLSAIYFGLFDKTKFLQPIEDIIDKLEEKLGDYWTYIIVATFFSIIFCTQLIVIMLITGIYQKKMDDKRLLMMDLANGAVLIPAIIPWNMASNLAFTLYKVSFKGALFNFLSLLGPIFYYFYRRKYIKDKAKQKS